VSEVSVCFAAKLVGIVRWSIHDDTVSMKGTIQKRPGPRGPQSGPGQDHRAFPLLRHLGGLHRDRADNAHHHQSNGAARHPGHERSPNKDATNTARATTLT
jgi:hypothetical protein